MSNDYFNSTLALQDFTRARGAPINALSAQIEAAFDILPAVATFDFLGKPLVTAGGTGNVLTITNATPLTSYGTGQRLTFKASATNTGAATINADGLGAKAIKRHDGSALVANDITTGRVYDIIYDGTNFVLTPVIDAAVSSEAAAASAAAAAATVATIDTATIVRTTGVQTITGTKLIEGNGDILRVGNASNKLHFAGDSSGVTLLTSTGSVGTGFYFNHTSSYIVAILNGVEKLRITSDGDVLQGTTTQGAGAGFRTAMAVNAAGIDCGIFKVNASGVSPLRAWSAAATGDNPLVFFATEAAYTNRGSITYNRGGGLVAYNTTSDYRAKQVLGPAPDSGPQIDAFNVFEGLMHGATISRPMMFAHEVAEIAPYAVTGLKDAVDEDGEPVFQQFDASALVPLLILELKSLRARVAALEAGPV